MMRKEWMIRCMGLLMAGLVMTGCSEEETGGITLSTTEVTELYSVTNQSNEVRFEATGKWTATCNANWLTFSPKSGEAGKNMITVSTTETNRTGNSRNAQMRIECEGHTKTVTIRQRGEYAVFESDELNLPSNGANIQIRFWSNITLEEGLTVYSTKGMEEWIMGENARTRGDKHEYVMQDLHVLANLSSNPREGAFFITMKDNKGNVLPLDTLFVFQEGADNGYHSIDYSQNGKVELLNKATVGKGIPIVLLGDGFVDEEIADSSYSRTMQQAMENLFSEEPIKSLREYFNVYQVTAVSYRNRFDGASTVFQTVPDHQTTGVEVNADSVMKYVKKVEGIDSIHSLAVVIMNTNINKGVTYMMRSNKKKDYSYAIAICPVIEDLKSEMFRSVLVHEAVGHGFAKLADEYERSTEGSATDDDIKQLKELHEDWGWYLNVDSEKDSTKVLWTRFIYDSEFANEEIGTYEGGYTFYKGIFRPTQESMMRSNNAPFNAPSRQIIYNMVMKMALDKTADYEEFVEFDKTHKPVKWSYETRARRKQRTTTWRPAPPRIIIQQ